jgi:hypothetical protein
MVFGESSPFFIFSGFFERRFLGFVGVIGSVDIVISGNYGILNGRGIKA